MNIAINFFPLFSVSYLLDLILGDPTWAPHPVKVIGYLARRLEYILLGSPQGSNSQISGSTKQLFSKDFLTSSLDLRKEKGLVPTATGIRSIHREKIAGFLFTLLITSSVFAMGWVLLILAWCFSVWLGGALSIILGYTCLSVRDMIKHADAVYQSLIRSEIDEARHKVGKIVSRDTGNLGEEEICRATVESIAESIVDGIISPLFYLFVGGPVVGPALALFYKAASTLDSMVGYRNERYFYFGWASARLDDILNYLPARIARFVVPLASVLSGKDGRGSLYLAFHEADHHPSPNSGIPEAAMAGALGIQLGGVNYYQGQKTQRPFIGCKTRPICPADINSALKIMLWSSWLITMLFLMVFIIVRISQ